MQQETLTQTWEEEHSICKEFLIKNKFYKWLFIRFFHGYQNFIVITGDTNSGKSIFADMVYYILNTGMYEKPMDLKDFYFGVRDIVRNIESIVKCCIINHEAGSKSKNWNDIQNEAWSQILQFGRIFRNTYIDCLPHRKDMTDIHLKHATFLIVVDNIIKDWVDDKENIEDYEIIRVARIYKLHTDYLGFNATSQQNSFVEPEFFDYFEIPNYKTDPRFRNFKKFIEEKYEPFDLENKKRLIKSIKEKADKRDQADEEKMNRIIAKLDKDKIKVRNEIMENEKSLNKYL
jgi:hypothetical protein